jgi:hypothetical protein
MNGVSETQSAAFAHVSNESLFSESNNHRPILSGDGEELPGLIFTRDPHAMSAYELHDYLHSLEAHISSMSEDLIRYVRPVNGCPHWGRVANDEQGMYD